MASEEEIIEAPKTEKPKAKKAKAKSAAYQPKNTRWLIRENGNAIKLFAGQTFEAKDAEAIKLCEEAKIPKA